MNAETMAALSKIAEMKGITQEEAIELVLERYAKRAMREIEKAHAVVDKIIEN